MVWWVWKLFANDAMEILDRHVSWYLHWKIPGCIAFWLQICVNKASPLFKLSQVGVNLETGIGPCKTDVILILIINYK